MQAYGYQQSVYMPSPAAPLRRGGGAPARPPVSYGRQYGNVVAGTQVAANCLTNGTPSAGSELLRDFSNLAVNSQSRSKEATSSTFRWRLDAPEFIPQALRHATVAQSIDHENSYEQSHQRTSVQQQSDQLHCFQWELVNWLSHLYMEPGNFEIIAHQISSQMNYTVRCERDLQAVMDKFFEVSMSYPHFSYHAARLCVHFNCKFNACPDSQSLFRSVLMKRCAATLEARGAMLEDVALVGHLHNFVMFMAELCVQFLVQGRPWNFVVDALFQLIGDLIQRPTELNIRCCISALKCCGAFLYHHSADRLQSVFEQLHSDAVLESVPPNLVLAIESLADVRAQWQKSSLEMLTLAEADDWAKNVAESAANSVLEQSDVAPVYYGPDGVPLTQEEAAFLAELEQQGSCDEELMQNGVLSEDDMIAEAYEEFLEMQKERK